VGECPRFVVARELLSGRRMRLSPCAFPIALVLAALAGAGCSAPAGHDYESGSSASTTSAPDPSSFTLPPSDAASRAQILSNYASVDPGGVVPRGLLEDALEFYDVNKSLITNQAYVVVVDFSRFSGEDRFFLVDMTSGAVESHKVAHGAGSDPNSTGYAQRFSNTPGSLMSSLGFYLTADIYDGTHPHSMHINGLSADGSPNSMADTNVLERAVVVHLATYVNDSNTGAQGRSDGCFALDQNVELGIVNKLTGGALMYAETSPLNPPVGQSGGGGGAGGGGGGTPSGDCTLSGQNYPANTCTETQQCDNGSWVARSSDASSCASGALSGGACVDDSGSVMPENTCTSTQQCDNGVWVNRRTDPSACL
jgi:L,D-transpeptidase catalytic domain